MLSLRESFRIITINTIFICLTPLSWTFLDTFVTFLVTFVTFVTFVVTFIDTFLVTFVTILYHLFIIYKSLIKWIKIVISTKKQ